MNSNTIAPAALIISDIAIRKDEQGRYLLNDLHKASGDDSRHKPANWLRNQQAIDLIQLLESEQLKAGIPAIQSKQQLGTYAVKELIYAYAMWISPLFHLAVIRAYDALVTAQPANITVTELAHLALIEEINDLHVEVAGLKDELLTLYRGKNPVQIETVYKVPVEAIELMARYNIPREDIIKASGRNSNCVRQHIFNARRAGRLA